MPPSGKSIIPSSDYSKPSGVDTVTLKWTRRLWAFLIDYAIIVVTWGAVKSFVTVPASGFVEVGITFGFFFWFCLYFLVSEGRGELRASPGKRFARIVVVAENDSLPSWQRSLARPAILAVFVFGAWNNFFAYTVPEIPLIGGLLISSVPIALTLFNTYLGIRGKGEVMLQDSLTNTTVIVNPGLMTSNRGPGPVLSGAPNFHWPRPVLCVLFVVVVSVAQIANTVWIVGAGALSQSENEAFEKYYQIVGSDPETIQAVIEKSLGIRTRVKFEFKEHKPTSSETNQPRTTSFTVSILLPQSAWNPQTLKLIGYTVLGQLSRESRKFGSRTIEYRRESGYLFYSSTVDLGQLERQNSPPE